MADQTIIAGPLPCAPCLAREEYLRQHNGRLKPIPPYTQLLYRTTDPDGTIRYVPEEPHGL